MSTRPREIEYKSDVYVKSDKDIAEFLADISSFANTVGGDIFIGISAKEGIPTDLAPLGVDCDAEIVRLESIARSGLQPRIHGLESRKVPLSDGGAVIIVRVPKSYAQPHRLIRNGTGHNRFYARSSAGKYEPNVDELRLLFAAAPQLAARIRDLRFERIARIAANDGFVPLSRHPILTLHIVPFTTFDLRLDFPLKQNSDTFLNFPFLNTEENGICSINFDGLLIVDYKYSNRPNSTYVQIYKTGIVESVLSHLHQPNEKTKEIFPLSAKAIEYQIAKCSHRYIDSLMKFGFRAPFAILVSIIGVKGIGYSFSSNNDYGFGSGGGKFDRDQFHFSEIIIESLSSDRVHHAEQIRPLFDQIANAANQENSPSFDRAGRSIGKWSD